MKDNCWHVLVQLTGFYIAYHSFASRREQIRTTLTNSQDMSCLGEVLIKQPVVHRFQWQRVCLHLCVCVVVLMVYCTDLVIVSC